MRKLLYAIGILIVLVVGAGYIFKKIVYKKIDEALRTLPSSIQLTHGSIHPDIWGRSLVINDVRLWDSGRQVSVSRLTVRGIHYFSLAASRRNVSFGKFELAGVRMEEKKKFSMEGDLTLDSVHIADLDKPTDSARFGAVRLRLEKLYYIVPGAYEAVQVRNLRLDSRDSSLQADTVRVIPTIDKTAIGGIKGHQVDCVEATGEHLSVAGLHVMALLRHRLIADKISIQRSHIYVFRDRRLPLAPGTKPLPVDYLKSLPVSIRVRSVQFAASSFTYEEFPNKGSRTGTLSIVRLSGTVTHLINHPESGDPAYITLVTDGALMGSGSVRATTKMPLLKDSPYLVEGAFHQLDVTTLNPSAENLGNIHLESGMLNSLAFRFRMDEEKATGMIIGEYHDLVVDKLRGGDEKKVDKVKSFFLKKLIIPKDKDHTLRTSKRTGKVAYRREPERYFSYYLLHALLVGVKSSFSLGFLLPG